MRQPRLHLLGLGLGSCMVDTPGVYERRGVDSGLGSEAEGDGEAGSGADLCSALPTQRLPEETMGAFDSIGASFLNHGKIRCTASGWRISTRVASHRDPPDAVEAQLWDLSTGAMLGTWALSNAEDPGDFSVSLSNEEVGMDCVGSPTAATLTAEVDGWPHHPVGGSRPDEGWAANRSYNSDGFRSQIYSPEHGEAWVWALYPELEESFGPFRLTSVPGGGFSIEVEAEETGLEMYGMVGGYIICEPDGSAITAAQ